VNSIGVAGFGLGLAIAAVGVLGLAVAFPPQPAPPAPVAIQNDDAAPDLSAPIAPDTPAPAPVTPEPDDAQPPALVLADDADAPQDALAPQDEVPSLPDTPPAVTDDTAQPPSALAGDQPAALPDDTGGAMRPDDLPRLAPPFGDMRPDMPAAVARLPDVPHDGPAGPDQPTGPDADSAPQAPQQDTPLAILPPTQGTGRAPRAQSDLPQPVAPPPASRDRAQAEDLPAPEGELPAPDTAEPDTAEPDSAEPDAPPADRDTAIAQDGSADADMAAPADTEQPQDAESGTSMPGNRIAGMPGQPLAPRNGVAPLPSRAVDTPSDETTQAPAPTATTALERNAIAVDPALTDGALMAIVLHDPGLPMPLRRELAARDTAFTVALNPMDPSASEAADLYHAAGKEVLILANGIPAGATESDIDVTFGAYFDNVPLAAAVIDLPRNGFVRNTRLMSDIMKVIMRDGYGLVTFAGGMGQAARSADALGVPHAEVFRILDAADESALTIRRFLDRAVFQASQVGYVIVFGEASNDSTLDALDLWQSEGRVDQISVVPVSAILLGR